MAERKRIGLFYESYRTLPAYVIYVQNLVRTLTFATPQDQPVLVILHLPDSPVDELKNTGYPHLEFYCLKNIYANPIKRLVNKVSRKLSGQNLLPFYDKGFPANLDVIFPYNFRPEAADVPLRLVWKPDFQEFHLPQYFEAEALAQHKTYLDMLSRSGLPLVLSSEDSRRDYERHYPSHNNRIFIWRFTSSLPDHTRTDITQLTQRYGISEKYFLVANQFWPHKNHLNVLKAIKHLAQTHPHFQVVFTGKQSSNRDGGLFGKLMAFIDQENIQKHCIFTGFISREEQVCLMKNAEAVIQPSLFEGWSTVIEDCRALGQFVLASRLSVNKEQLKENALFFDPYDYRDIAAAMAQVLQSRPAITRIDYHQQVLQFRDTILNTFKQA